MKLALLFHCPDVDEFASGLSAEQIAEWAAYFNIEPAPDPWFQTGTIAAEIANMMRSKGKRAKISDFYPKPIRAKKKKSKADPPKVIEGALLAFMARNNMKVNK